MSDTVGVTATGRCLCGAVGYLTTGPLRPVWNCHCERCRRTSGHFVAATPVALADLAVDADATLRWYRPPEEPTIGYAFCTVCGASVFWRDFDRETMSIHAGTLDQPTGLRTEGTLFVDQAGDYHELQPTPQMIPADRPV